VCARVNLTQSSSSSEGAKDNLAGSARWASEPAESEREGRFSSGGECMELEPYCVHSGKQQRRRQSPGHLIWQAAAPVFVPARVLLVCASV
jgi:hypothetical protein